jgi:hypothetical protein
VRLLLPPRQQLPKALADGVWPLMVLFWFATLGVSSALARAWSYHYKPTTPGPSPAASATEASIPHVTPGLDEQGSTARLLKRTIVSDLAVFVEQQGGNPGKAYADHAGYLVHQLSLFDPLGSPAALEVFAGLSGYYLGARAQQLYDCLSLRKGKILEPYLQQYIHNGNGQCTQELGQSFTKPRRVPGGYALCPSGQQQTAHLRALIAEIDSGKLCSNSELTAITASARPSPADSR